ncbi:hypothetical protein BHE74_00039847 [Ensete ventricosum]|nr:hypothetical protein BHE74_00039847 [Ensete ventricosum]
MVMFLMSCTLFVSSYATHLLSHVHLWGPSIAWSPNPTHPHLQYSSSSSTASSFSSFPPPFPSRTVPWHMPANWAGGREKSGARLVDDADGCREGGGGARENSGLCGCSPYIIFARILHPNPNPDRSEGPPGLGFGERKQPYRWAALLMGPKEWASRALGTPC